MTKEEILNNATVVGVQDNKVEPENLMDSTIAVYDKEFVYSIGKDRVKNLSDTALNELVINENLEDLFELLNN